MLVSATYTNKIFNILTDKKLKANWKKLRILMFLFFFGYLIVIFLVAIGRSELLTLLSGVIFFMGALFVFMVVRAGLDSFRKLKELNQNLDDTQLKNNELEQFAHITSHDLKTPIRGISSLATFIEEDLKAGQTSEVFNHLNIIQGEVERLENLINGILNYSKIGKITLEAIDLDTMVREEFKTRKTTHKTAIFRVKNKLPVIIGDEVQISQVVANLISNAINHNDKEICEVYVSSTETSKFYEIVFEDNGPGIDPKYHQKIFEVFQSLQEEDTYESTGIGLSIVKKVIEKHKGTINITSNDKLGAKFSIYYPKKLKRKEL